MTGHLKRFDDAVRCHGHDPQSAAELLHRLMMPGRRLQGGRAHDLRDQTVGFDFDILHLPQAFLIAVNVLVTNIWDMLVQAAACRYVQYLKAAANAKQRRVVLLQQMPDERQFTAVSLVIGR